MFVIQTEMVVMRHDHSIIWLDYEGFGFYWNLKKIYIEIMKLKKRENVEFKKKKNLFHKKMKEDFFVQKPIFSINEEN